MASPYDTPVTQVPTDNPKQPVRPPSSTPKRGAPWGHNRLESGLKPKGNGTPPTGSRRK